MYKKTTTKTRHLIEDKISLKNKPFFLKNRQKSDQNPKKPLLIDKN